MVFTGIEIDPQKLKSKDEALSILKENGWDYQARMMIANEYNALYGNELIWHNPLCYTDYTGVHIIPVQEGFLCVPYDVVHEDDHELFELDRAFMLDAESAEVMLNEWKSYSEGFIGAMDDMIRILKQNN